MAKYDPNWLKKETTKHVNTAIRQLTHIADSKSGSICGKGPAMAMAYLRFPSMTNLPTCRPCREKFLQDIGVVEIDENGYPK